MTIISVELPPGSTGVRYGRIALLADATLDVPAYVAKTLASIDGVVTPGLPGGTAAELLAAVTEPFEANYVFQANGHALPAEAERIADAVALFASSGEPTVSLI